MNSTRPHDELIEGYLDGRISRQDIAARVNQGLLPPESAAELNRFLSLTAAIGDAVQSISPSPAAAQRWREQIDRLTAGADPARGAGASLERADTSPLHLTETDGELDDASLPFPTPVEEDQYDVRAAGRDDESPPAESGKGAGHDPD